MRQGRLLLTALMLLLNGCATYPDLNQQRLDSLPQHYDQFDLQLAWETKLFETATVIDGVVKNVRYAYMNNVELWVALLDQQGKVIARSAYFVIPIQLPRDTAATFGMKLPVRAAPGSRLRFTYKYVSDEGGDRGTGLPWMQSFEAVVPSR